MPTARRHQLNIELSADDELVLSQACAIDQTSRPELARAVLSDYLARRIAAEADLRTAVEAIRRARAKRPQNEQTGGTNVLPLRPEK